MEKIKGKSFSKTPEVIKMDGEWNLGQTLKKTHNSVPLFDKLFCGFDLLAFVTGYLVKKEYERMP